MEQRYVQKGKIMKNMNHERYLKLQAKRATLALRKHKESKEERMVRLQYQQQRSAVYASKRRKLMDRALCME